MMKKICPVLFAFLLTFNGQVYAEPGPQELIKQVTEDVLTALRELNQDDNNKSDAVSDKVKELILPHLDFEAMSKKVLGKHWRDAKPAQRDAFIEQFKQLLIRTYETSLSKYSEEKVEFLPFRPGKDADKLAVVKSEIIRSSGPTIPINYSLLKKPGVDWKVYDIGIEGVSLVTNYRSSFYREIDQKGIDGLIQSLAERNQAQKADKEPG